MKRTLLIVGVLALAAIVGGIVALNPGEVEFHPTHIHSFRPTLGVLLIATFFAGAVLALLAGSLRQLGSLLGNWRGRRTARNAAQAGEWHRTGEQLAWGGELERSRTLLRKAWRRHPGNSNAALALASSYLDTGEYAAAQEVLENAVAQHAGDPDLRYALGETLRRRGDSAGAIRMLETVRVQHPHAPRVLVSLRELYRESGRWAEASEVQDVYLGTLPAESRPAERERLVAFRYQAAMHRSDPEERLTALDAVVQMDRGFVPALVSLGDALLACGRADEAKRLWEKAFRSQPRLILIERLLAAAGNSRERERALALVGKASEQFDGDTVRLLIARAALAEDALERAEAQLTALVHRDAPEAQRCWAELYHRRGDHAAAWTALNHAANHRGPVSPEHHCTVCGRTTTEWTGYCAACERWDTYRADSER